MKPIIEQFCAAKNFLNEWRDTLSYGSFGVVTGALLYNGNLSKRDVAIGFVPALREMTRGLFWQHFPNNRQIAGSPQAVMMPENL